MKKYKVEFVKTYVIDVLAKDEIEAHRKAQDKFSEACENSMEHYHEIDCGIGNTYDVTNTDDPFNP